MDKRNHALDALKGGMILLIILHHGGLLPFLRHGYLGVDVFFVIAGYFLMQGFAAGRETAVAYTRRRIRSVYLPYLFALLLACVLDYKHLSSFSGGQGFLDTYAPMAAFLTLTEELGFVFHTPVILVGGWFLSVLLIGGFLLYGLLEYNERLATKVILPFAMVLGFTWLFSLSANIENFRTVGAVGLPLLRGFLEMGLGVLCWSVFSELKTGSKLSTALFFAAMAVFVAMLLSERSLDGFLIFVIPLMLSGVQGQESWLRKAYDRLPTKWLAALGALSLELYLIHQPVLHIVHSGFKFLNLPWHPALIVPADLVASILAAVLLRGLCRRLRTSKSRV